MYSEIVVLSSKTGFNSKTYTYKNPSDIEIKTGQLVKVSFGSQNYFGIVASQTAKTTLKNTKTISTVYGQLPLISQSQFNLFKLVAEHYRGSVSDLIKLALPTIPVRQLKLLEKTPSDHNQPSELIIIPSEIKIPEIISQLSPNQKIIPILSTDTPSEKFQKYIQILSGQAQTIIGARSSILLPINNLSKITIYDEEDPAYQEERSPYYNSIKVAELRTQLPDQPKLILITSSPSLSSFLQRKNSLKIIPLETNKKVKIISFNQYERYQTKSAFLTKIAIDQVSYNLRQKKSTLIYLNRVAPKGFLFCQSCQFKKILPNLVDLCPNCRSPRLKFFSPNIFNLSSEIKKLFPLSKSSIIDAKTKPDFTSDIYLATKSATYLSFPESLGSIIITNTDDLFYPYNFNSEMEGFQTLRKLLRIPANLYLLQSKNPDNHLISQSLIPNPNIFVDKQLKLRQSFRLPPYTHCLTINISGKNTKLLKNKTKKVVRLIKESGNKFSIGEIVILKKISTDTFISKIPIYHPNLKAFDIITTQLPRGSAIKINYRDSI